MNNIKTIVKNSIKEYLPTIICSILITVAICFAVQLELLFRSEKIVTSNGLSIKYLSKFCTIEELEKYLVTHPNDDIVHIRIAQVYESLGKYEKANEYYKKGLKLSGRTNYALYSYGIFCAKHGLYVIAATMAEELNGKPKFVNLFKAKIYEQIGKGLLKDKNYKASTKSYHIALKYAKNTHDNKFLESIKKQYADAYVYLADYNMTIDEPDEAIANLNNSLKIKDNAPANYKLGVILLNLDLYNAEKHINKAFSKNPYIVNPYIYNNVLEHLLETAKKENKGNLIHFYSSRMARFKKVLNEAYLYKTDISIDNSMLLVKKGFLKKDKRFLYFELKNNTKNNLNDLYLKSELYVNSKPYVTEKHIITPTKPLEGLDTLKYTDYNLPQEILFNNLEQNNDIFVRYYAKKKPEAPWVLIKIDFINI